MSALPLKGQKHRWYCICAICIWLNSLITMVDSWVNNIQAECTQTNWKYKPAWVLVLPYVHKKNLPDWSFFFYTIQRSSKTQSNSWGLWKWVHGCFQKTPTPGALIMRVHVMFSLPRWLHWIFQVNYNVFCCCCCCLFHFKVHMKTTNYIQ